MSRTKEDIFIYEGEQKIAVLLLYLETRMEVIMGEYYMISDAAREVQVENHVLRYWEEELDLPIHRNESGHRIYTQEDVQRFRQIKHMKEKGLQLKAIYTLLKKGCVTAQRTSEEEATVTTIAGVEELAGDTRELPRVGIDIINVRERTEMEGSQYEPADGDKLHRIQLLMHQLVQKSLEDTLPAVLEQAMEHHNKLLRQDIRESMLKELDYQFRMQEERQEERDRLQQERNELYYAQIDELLRRKKSQKKRRFL